MRKALETPVLRLTAILFSRTATHMGSNEAILSGDAGTCRSHETTQMVARTAAHKQPAAGRRGPMAL